MFKKEFTLNDDFPNTQGLRRLYLDENCKEKYGFTDEEFTFLIDLRYFDKHEKVPKYKNGFRTEKTVILDPFCVALFDTYYGAKMILKNIMFSPHFDKDPMLGILKIIKSIVKKYSPTEYKKMF
jgi:hypothetical protein